MSCSRPLHVRIESIRSRLIVSFRMIMDSSISGQAADVLSTVTPASGRLSMNKNSSTLGLRWCRSPPQPPAPRGFRCLKLYHRSLSDDCVAADDGDDVAVQPLCLLCTFRLIVLSSGTAAADTSRYCRLAVFIARARHSDCVSRQSDRCCGVRPAALVFGSSDDPLANVALIAPHAAADRLTYAAYSLCVIVATVGTMIVSPSPPTALSLHASRRSRIYYRVNIIMLVTNTWCDDR